MYRGNLHLKKRQLFSKRIDVMYLYIWVTNRKVEAHMYL